MKTYMKYLDESSVEYQRTRSIHDELDRIARRCEEELVVSPGKFSDLKDRLEGRFECIKDHRRLLWHGPLKKQSPRRQGEIAERYMILFSDCILVCIEDSGRKLDIKRELSMKDLVLDIVGEKRASVLSSNEQTNTSGSVAVYYPFRVNAVEKSYEFLVKNEPDRAIWVRKIKQASDDYNKRNLPVESK